MGAYYAEKQYNDEVGEEEAKEEWVYKNAEIFLDAVRDILKDETFLNGIADDLATNYIDIGLENGSFYNAYDLERVHAVCHLASRWGGWEKELKEEWKKYLNRDRD